MGSDSDIKVMDEAASILKEFGVPYERIITSAHRSPDKTIEFARNAEKRGVQIIIVGTGYAAHLAGVIAANTTLPVIGVPLAASALKGIDSLLSIVQMPKGIPVAAVALGEAGAGNAALLAIQILALNDSALKERLDEYRRKMTESILKKDELV